MERLEDSRIIELRKKGINIYSISRLNCMDQCPYQAYLRYVRGESEIPSVWGQLGDKVHDALQQCIDTRCDESVIRKAISDELLDLDILGLEFPRDRNGNPTIRDNWITNMLRFADEFKTPKGNFETEQLVLYPVDEKSYMQGYIDLIKHNNDGSISIIDWKTSSQFDSKHLISAGRQLVLYGMAKQLEGYEIKRLCWVMLKYCKVSWQLKSGKIKEKVCEWRNLSREMYRVVDKKLEELGYESMDIDCIMTDSLNNNKIPDEVKDYFSVNVYVRDYEFNQNVIDETKQYLKNKISQFEEYGTDESNYQPCDITKESYFCSSLCGFSRKCKYYRDYLEQFSTKRTEDDDDIF